MANKALLAITVLIIIGLVATMIAFMIKSKKPSRSGAQSTMPSYTSDPLPPQPTADDTSSQPMDAPYDDLTSAQQKEYQAILAHNSEFTNNIRRIREVTPEDSGSGAMAVVNATCRGSVPSISYSSKSCFPKDPVLGYRLHDGDKSGPFVIGSGAMGNPF